MHAARQITPKTPAAKPAHSGSLSLLGIFGFFLLVPGAAQAQSGQSLAEGQADSFQLQIHQQRVSSFMDGALQNSDKLLPTYLGPSAATRASAGAFASYAPTWAGGLRLGVFVASDTWIQGTPGTLFAMAAANRATPPTVNASHTFDGHSQSMRRHGFGVGKEFPTSLLGGATVLAGARIFAVTQFRELAANGVLTESSNGSVGLLANTLEHKLGGESLFITPPQSLGKGASVDFGLRWGAQDATHVRVSAEDVGPAVHIDHLLQTRSTINTQQVSYDANGNIQFAPLINGKYTDVAYRAKLQPRYVAAGDYRLSPTMALLVRLQSSYPITELALGTQWWVQNQQLQTMVYLSKEVPASLGVTWLARHFSLSWRGDKLSSTRARVWGLSAQTSF